MRAASTPVCSRDVPGVGRSPKRLDRRVHPVSRIDRRTHPTKSASPKRELCTRKLGIGKVVSLEGSNRRRHHVTSSAKSIRSVVIRQRRICRNEECVAQTALLPLPSDSNALLLIGRGGANSGAALLGRSFFAAQYFRTPSLIRLIAAGLIFFLATGAPFAAFETAALPTPKYRPSARRSFLTLVRALSVV